LSVAERGVDAASLSLFPPLSLNSNLVGSFTLKRPEGRAPHEPTILGCTAEKLQISKYQTPKTHAESNGAQVGV